MPRVTKKKSVVESAVMPVLQSLSPRDALAVELALETVRIKGRMGADMALDIVEAANKFAELLGWSKRTRTAREHAEEVLSGADNGA